MATLTAKNLAKAYKGRRVVEDVSLTVNSGEIVGLLGPNGAGKTTTFYMVVGIVPRDAGNIIIDDEDISLLPLHARARRGIGYLPQEASIFRRLSVFDNLMAVLQIRDDLTSEQRQDRANELMEEFHIEHLRDSLGQALSGGNAAVLKLHARWQQTRSSSCWMNHLQALTPSPLSTLNVLLSICATAVLAC
ncbi:ATP-binding cassette domain-containing protein [Enterobacter cloacae]|uniref:ATP-binding cassette domain-containing protein n=1 Tax=Enterobacter cloacae TaxID=550 RepID=UPI0034641874